MFPDSRKSAALFEDRYISPAYSPNHKTASIAVYLLHLFTHIDNSSLDITLHHNGCILQLMDLHGPKHVAELLNIKL